MTRKIGLLFVVGLLAGCGSGAANKAGGSSTPLVLSLADSNNSDQPDADTIERFAAQVKKRSGGSLRIRITYLAAGSSSPYVETKTIDAVKRGQFDLGWVGARAWDLNGVTTFRALQAPFLVTSLRLLNRVVASPLANEMLQSLTRSGGVVGIALVPDFLRHPVGMGRPFVKPSDFVGARIRIQPSRVTAAIIKALGARPVEISNDSIGLAIDRKQVDAQEVALLNSPGGSVLTENVVFFGKTLTLFANNNAYHRLNDDQRRVIQEAADDMLHYALAHHPPDVYLAKGYCYDRRRIVFARRGDVRTLVRKEQPVYQWLESDPQTKRFIDQIEALKRTTVPDPTATSAKVPTACRKAPRSAQTPGAPQPASLVNGTYRSVITRADAEKYWHTSPPPGNDTFPIVVTVTVRNGKWRFAGPDHDHGTYTIRGDRIRFVWPRVATVLIFQFTRDPDATLHLKPVLPMDSGDQFIWSSQPWRRIGPPTTTER